MQRRDFLRGAGGVGSSAALTASAPLALFDSWLTTPRERAVEDAEEALGGMMEPLRDSDDYAAAGKDVAREVCHAYEEVKSLDEKVFDAVRDAENAKELPTEARHYLSLVEGFIEIFNERLDVDIGTEDLRHVDTLFKRAANLVPLVMSSKRVADAGCRMLRAKEDSKAEDEALVDFLTACGILCAEALMIGFSVGFRISFGATRLVANNLLVRIRGLVGLKVYSLLLREVHWTVRESISDAVGAIIQITETISTELPSLYSKAFDPDDLSELKQLKQRGDGFWQALEDKNTLDDGDGLFKGDDGGGLFRDDADIFSGGIDLPI